MDSSRTTEVPPGSFGPSGAPQLPPQLALLDFFFPGMSAITGSLAKYLHVDISLYFTVLVLFGGLTFVWRYLADTFWGWVDVYFLSTADIRPDDELYNYVMAWVSAQKFAKGSRRFIANVNVNSRYTYNHYDYDPDDSEDENSTQAEKQPLSYTPTFGSHYFWYKNRLLVFRRTENRDSASQLLASEREEISICSFGRNPWVLKTLLQEARELYMKKDGDKTLIYRGATRAGGFDPMWQRSMARTSRPLSTVILDEKVKQDLIDDVADYLDPATRRWYSNRGIPYRRGYLLYGPPGTGKSSLSLALAGHFKMRIYIVSLNSVTTGEESLASLFAELPRRCVVLLEDIDTAGLSHTREEGPDAVQDETRTPKRDASPSPKNRGSESPAKQGRLSLSGLLNILDGVASQEGRVLIMTTNHLEKLDKALIRPGRVDMIVKFDLADHAMTAAIFRAIFAPLEADEAEPRIPGAVDTEVKGQPKAAKMSGPQRAELVTRVNGLAERFAAAIPPHEFSPAEIQGYLLKHKRHPETAVDGAQQWVVEMREERDKKKEREKADKEAEAKKANEAKRESEESKKEDRQSRDEGSKTSNLSPAQAASETTSEGAQNGDGSSVDTSTAKAEVAEAGGKKTEGGRLPDEENKGEENKHGDVDSGYATPGE